MTGPVHARRRQLGRRGTLVLLTGALGVLLSAGAAFAYWSTSDGTRAAGALAETLPAGPPTTATAGGATVTIDFPIASTSPASGRTPLTDYTVRRYPEGTTGKAAASATFACQVPVARSVTCTEKDVPDGSWIYTTAPVLGLWTGTEGDKAGSTPVTVDTVAPVVTVTAPSNGSVVSTTTPALSGAAGTAAGDASLVTVRVYAGSGTGGALLQTKATTATAGTWSVPASALAPNAQFTVEATQSDAAGNTGIATSTFVVDGLAPVVSLSTPSHGSATSSSVPTFTGTAGTTTASSTASADLTEVTVRLYSGAGVGGTLLQTLATTADPRSGAYSVSASGPLANGTYTVQAGQDDAAGNRGLSPANTFTVDATVAVVAITAPTNNVYLTATPMISGSATVGGGKASTVTVEVHAGAAASGSPIQSLTATVNVANGLWSATPDPLAGDAQYTVVARQADDAGNVGVSPTRTFVIDDSAPVVTIATPADGSVSTTTTPAVSGTAGRQSADATGSADATTVTMKIYSGAVTTGTALQTKSATVTAGATYSVAASTLANGQYTALVTQTDAVGNIGSARSTFTVSPVPAVTLTVPAAGAYLTDTTPTISGAAGNGVGDSTTVTVSVYSGAAAGGTPVHVLAVTRTGTTWTVSAPALDPDEQYTVRATQTNAFGSTGTSAARTFVVDTTAPVVGLTTPAPGSVVSTGTPAFAGTAGKLTATATTSKDTSPVTVRLYSGTGTGGTLLQTRTATVNQTTGAYTVNASPTLPSGTYTAQVTQTDGAGNISLTPASTFTVSLAPAVTVTSPVASSATNSTTPTFSGAAGTAAGDSTTVTVSVFAGATATGTPLQSLAVTAAGDTWSVVAGALTPNAQYTVRATQAHSGGTVGTSNTRTFVVDTTAPVVGITAPAAAATVTTATPTVSGTAGRLTASSTRGADTLSVTVEVFSGPDTSGTLQQTTAAAVNASSGAYSTVLAAMPNGTYTVRVTQADAAGNTASVTRTFTVSAP